MKKIPFSLLLFLGIIACPTIHGQTLLVMPIPQQVFETPMLSAAYPRYAEIRITCNGFDGTQIEAVAGEIEALAVPSSGVAFTIECRIVPKPAGVKGLYKNTVLGPYWDKLGAEGYLLSKKEHQAVITAHTVKGIFHGLQTLKQLLRAEYAGNVEIADWPDFEHRIAFDDICRGPLPNIPQVKRQIEQLSEMKYSALTFYIEHVVQVSEYPDFAPVNGKYTMADVREICDYAARYQMEVIGSFQSFGHFEHILRIPKYAPMGETPSLISPVDPQARKFLASVIGELCDNFSSEYFNINCDETWDLDKGRSRDYVAQIGADRFYADHIRFLYDVVKAKGKKTMVWADIIMKYPDMIKSLPKDLVYLPWNYSDLTDFSAWIKPFADAGAVFMVCPGVVSSNRLIPEMQLVRGNMEFIRQGYAAGAGGVMMTSWDDASLHNFSSLWYGFALAGETMWHVGQAASKADFDRRFELVRFGNPDAGFVRAMDKLVELTKLSVTYQMNNKVFYDRFVPLPGEGLSVNMVQWAKADTIVTQAEALSADIRYTRNANDIETFRYTLGQYRFMVDARKTVAATGGAYAEALQLYASDAGSARRKLVSALDDISLLSAARQALENEFIRLWLRENMSYSLDHDLGYYRVMEEQTGRMRQVLIDAVDRIDRGMAPVGAVEAGLGISHVNSDYFGAWLFTGIYPGGDLDTDVLAPVGGELKADPIPGERYTIDGQDYIWTRVHSPNGFAMDFHEKYESDNDALAYATAVIISDREQEVTVLLGCSGEAVLICNGERVLRTGQEQAFIADKYPVVLKLKEGNNRIIIKSKQLVNEWRFSFRVDGREIQAHKQRYRIQ